MRRDVNSREGTRTAADDPNYRVEILRIPVKHGRVWQFFEGAKIRGYIYHIDVKTTWTQSGTTKDFTADHALLASAPPGGPAEARAILENETDGGFAEYAVAVTDRAAKTLQISGLTNAKDYNGNLYYMAAGGLIEVYAANQDATVKRKLQELPSDALMLAKQHKPASCPVISTPHILVTEYLLYVDWYGEGIAWTDTNATMGTTTISYLLFECDDEHVATLSGADLKVVTHYVALLQ